MTCVCGIGVSLPLRLPTSFMISSFQICGFFGDWWSGACKKIPICFWWNDAYICIRPHVSSNAFKTSITITFCSNQKLVKWSFQDNTTFLTTNNKNNVSWIPENNHHLNWSKNYRFCYSRFCFKYFVLELTVFIKFVKILATNRSSNYCLLIRIKRQF